MIILIIRVYLTSILMHNQIDSGHLHSLHKDNWAVSEQLKPSLLLLLWAVCIVGFSRLFLMCWECGNGSTGTHMESWISSPFSGFI